MSTRVKILFTDNAPEREGGPFAAGEVREMSAASARHWIRRRRAELIEGDLNVKPTVAGVPRQEVVAEMAEQIGELANAEVDSAQDVAGEDGAAAGDRAEPDAADDQLVPRGSTPAGRRGRGGSRQ